jgi:dihydrofolate synthase/folylpolyglutamate synthase
VALEEAGKFRIPVEAVRAGVAATRWPGRFEVVARSPLVIVDGAHCALSVGALADTYADIFGPKPAVLVAGFMRDKAVEAICKALAVPRMNIREVVCCTPPSPRALPADRAAEIVSATLGIAAVAVEEPRDAVARALASAGNDAAVVAFGSMYLVAPAKETVQALVPAK